MQSKKLNNLWGNWFRKETLPTKDINGVRTKAWQAGSSGTEIYGGYLEEELLSELRGTKGADKFNEMRRSDSNVAMVLKAMKQPIRSAQFSLKLLDDTPQAEAQKALFEYILFKDLGKPWTRFVGEALSFVDFGYSLFEKTYKPVLNHPEFGSFLGVKSLGFRSQRTIERWLVDQNGKLLSVEQWADGDVGRTVQMDADFLMHFCPDQEGDNFEGLSTLRPCYGPWFRKNLYQKLLAAGLEKYAIPVPILTVPSGKENSEEFENALAVLRAYTSNQSNYITKPAGWEIEMQEVTIHPEKIREVITAENQEMVNSVLAGFLMLGQSNSGSYSLGSTLSDFFGASVQFLGDHLCEVVTSGLLTELCKLNFADEPLRVSLVVDGIRDSASASFADVLQKLSAAQLLKPDSELEKHLREKYKLPMAEQAALPTPTPAAQPIPGSAQPAGEDVQKSALNGAQVTSLVEVVSQVAAGALPRDSAINIVQLAFQVGPDEAQRILGSAGQGFTPKPEVQPSIQFAEKKRPNQERLIRSSADELRAVVGTFLSFQGEDYIERIRKEWLKASETARPNIPNTLELSVDPFYLEVLRYLSTYQATQAVAPLKSNLQLATPAERYEKARAQLDEMEKLILQWEAMPPGNERIDLALRIQHLRRSTKNQLTRARNELEKELSNKSVASIKARTLTLAQTQVEDVKKKVDLQYQSSLPSTDSERTLFQDLSEAKEKFIAGPVVETGPNILASQNVNETILTETEGEPEVESYTFVAANEPGTCALCEGLDGRTFAPNDPDLFRYHPPLHHQCNCYMAVNLKTFKGNPAITAEPLSLSADQLGKITLSEGRCCGPHKKT